jgi:ABC-type uncharacterized transport system YnjBCD ATPase subunit
MQRDMIGKRSRVKNKLNDVGINELVGEDDRAMKNGNKAIIKMARTYVTNTRSLILRSKSVILGSWMFSALLITQ